MISGGGNPMLLCHALLIWQVLSPCHLLTDAFAGMGRG